MVYVKNRGIKAKVLRIYANDNYLSSRKIFEETKKLVEAQDVKMPTYSTVNRWINKQKYIDAVKE